MKSIRILDACNGPHLLVIDTLADTFGGDEIKRAHARQFIGIAALASPSATTARFWCSITRPVAGMNSGTGTSGSTGVVKPPFAAGSISIGCGESDGSELDPDIRVLRTMKNNYGRTGEEIHVRWKGGVFVVEGSDASSDPLIAKSKADRLFLTLLGKYNFQQRSVSASTGHGYAPKVFEAEARQQGVTKRALTDAMNRLLETGRIRVETYGPPSRRARRLVLSTPTADA